MSFIFKSNMTKTMNAILPALGCPVKLLSATDGGTAPPHCAGDAIGGLQTGLWVALC